MKSANPNPAGKAGKPFTLAPHSFDDALRKILAAPPEPKAAKKTASKKTARSVDKETHGGQSNEEKGFKSQSGQVETYERDG